MTALDVDPTHVVHRLSPREIEVLELIAGGWSNRGIAAVLFCSGKTVERHVTSIFSKLEIPEDTHTNRRVAAAMLWTTGRERASDGGVVLSPTTGGGPADGGRSTA